MEKSIITELYYGNIKPVEMDIAEKENYEKHSNNFLYRMESFVKKLPPELKEEFMSLCEEEIKSEEILHRDGFYKGFQMGMRLTVEALKNN